MLKFLLCLVYMQRLVVITLSYSYCIPWIPEPHLVNSHRLHHQTRDKHVVEQFLLWTVSAKVTFPSSFMRLAIIHTLADALS